MKKAKILASIVAASICGSTLLGGTMAWQSISQEVTNEVQESVNPGGRLHDDFNGQNKDIYVENFGDRPIFARVKLKEYLEIGLGAGEWNLPERNVEIVTKDINGADALYNDKNTWPVHIYDGTDPNDDNDAVNASSKYWEWVMGGQKVYMPTFNMNKDSIRPDVNGTLAGKEGENTPYSDYVTYTLNQELTHYEEHDADTNSIEEDNPVINENVFYWPETHVAATSGFAKVITMEGWQKLTAEEKQVPYWVFDTDGWAYYSQPIAPKSATGLLLNEIRQVEEFVDEHSYYYAIHVISQFVTADDVGSPEQADGFYTVGHGPEPSHDALLLLVENGGITTATAYKYGDAIEQAAAKKAFEDKALDTASADAYMQDAPPAYDPVENMTEAMSTDAQLTEPEPQTDTEEGSEEGIPEQLRDTQQELSETDLENSS